MRSFAECTSECAETSARWSRRYKHPAPEINDILELLALARAEGLDVSVEIEDLLGKIAIKARAA